MRDLEMIYEQLEQQFVESEKWYLYWLKRYENMTGFNDEINLRMHNAQHVYMSAKRVMDAMEAFDVDVYYMKELAYALDRYDLVKKIDKEGETNERTSC